MFGAATGSISGGGTYTTLPGLTQTVTVPAATDVFVSTDGGIQATAGTPVVDVAVAIDGTPSSTATDSLYTRILVPMVAFDFRYWSRSAVVSVSPGTHTFEVQAQVFNGAGNSADVSAGASNVLRGSLTVGLIRN